MFEYLLWFGCHGRVRYAKPTPRRDRATAVCSCLAPQTCTRYNNTRTRFASHPLWRMWHRTVWSADVWQRRSTRSFQRVKTWYEYTCYIESTLNKESLWTVFHPRTSFANSYAKVPESTAVRENLGRWLSDIIICMLETSNTSALFLVVMFIEYPGCICNGSCLSDRTYICERPYALLLRIEARSFLRMRINNFSFPSQFPLKLLQSLLSKPNACSSVVFCRYGMNCTLWAYMWFICISIFQTRFFSISRCLVSLSSASSMCMKKSEASSCVHVLG